MKKILKAINQGWGNKIGFYPTPEEIVNQFSSFTYKFILDKFETSKQIKVLDLFAGDGRLGYSIQNLLKKNKYLVSQTYIEIQEEEVSKIKALDKKSNVIKENAFFWKQHNEFDLVVSNPPYLILNSPEAKNLGFEWDNAKKYGRNLYTLGIIKGLDVCKEGGVLAVISPFSWLRNEFSQTFRQEINERCSEVLIRANDHRTVFKGVNQDIGIQFFVKRTKSDNLTTKWMFGYNEDRLKKILFKQLNEFNKHQAKLQSRVMVGPIVWNRNKENLTSKMKNTTLVIYGGNITPEGHLDIENVKYSDKQYIRNTVLTKNCLFESPLILIRRIMRGIPGNWKIDSCLIEKPFKCTVENHVIVIEIPKGKVDSYKNFHKDLMSKIKEYYYFSGSPSISGKVVKRLIGELEYEYNCLVKKQSKYNSQRVLVL